MLKYAIIDPLSGLYTYANTTEERNDLLAKTAWSFYLAQTNNQPYTNVEVKEDGSESWSAINGEPVLSPKEFEQLINSFKL